MSTIFLVQGDTGPQIFISVTREDTGAAINVSGGSALLKVRKKGTTSLSFTLTAADVGQNLADGKLFFSLDGNQLATITAGDYEGELQLTLSTGIVETVFEKIDIVIREDF